MIYEPGAIDAALAAAVGEESGLVEELKRAFVEGAERALETLKAARDDQAWRAAAWRLKGLAASFGAVDLMALATTAATRPARDPTILAELKDVVERL